MVRIIVNIALLIVLAVFVAFNMPYRTAVNLFGWQLEELSTVAVILISVVIGVLYSFTLYVAAFLGRTRRTKMRTRSSAVDAMAKSLKTKEKNLEDAEIALDSQVSGGPVDDARTEKMLEPPSGKTGKNTVMSRIFSRKKEQR